MNRFRPCIALLALLGSACGAPGALPGPAPVPANVHPGFDTSRYPGEAAMRTWRETSPYRWVGYYLPAPCHRDASWAGTRAVLERQGWGIAVLYVGQQAFEESASTQTASGGPVLCSRSLLTAERGRADAQDAVQKTGREGFPRGSVIYLDVEKMQRVPPEMIAYYRAWTDEVLRDGRYVPGTYAHRDNAAELFALAQASFAQARRSDTPPFWIAGGGPFGLSMPPYASGFPFARIWQGALDVPRSWGGVTLQIDENTSDRPSPSAPR